MADVWNWYQGESKKLTVNFFESDGVTPKPLTDYSNIIFYFYNVKSGTCLAKYSMVALSGYDTANVVQVDIPGGELMVKIQASVTLPSELGQYYLEIKRLIIDTDMDSNVFKKIGKKRYFIMNPAKTKAV